MIEDCRWRDPTWEYNSILRYPIETVIKGFLRAPTDIVDDGDPLASKPIPICPHAVSGTCLEWFREILAAVVGQNGMSCLQKVAPSTMKAFQMSLQPGRMA